MQITDTFSTDTDIDVQPFRFEPLTDKGNGSRKIITSRHGSSYELFNNTKWKADFIEI